MNKTFEVLLKTVRHLSPKPVRNRYRLVTIPLSHFSEKARWVLDLSPLDYYEETHVPAFHLSSTVLNLRLLPRVGNWGEDKLFEDSIHSRFDSPKEVKVKEATGVPKLVVPASDDGKNPMSVVPHGSSGIIRYLTCRFPEELGHLYPIGNKQLYTEVLELEALLDRDLASAAVHWSFGNLLLTGSKFDHLAESGDANQGSVDFFISQMSSVQGIPWIERTIFSATAKRLICPMMASANKVNRITRDEAEHKIHSIFAHLDEKYFSNADRKDSDYLLTSDKPTAADIALAALSVSFLLPAETGQLFGTLEDLEQQTHNAPGCLRIANLCKKLRAEFKSARFALRMYKEYRFTAEQYARNDLTVKFKTIV